MSTLKPVAIPTAANLEALLSAVCSRIDNCEKDDIETGGEWKALCRLLSVFESVATFLPATISVGGFERELLQTCCENTAEYFRDDQCGLEDNPSAGAFLTDLSESLLDLPERVRCVFYRLRSTLGRLCPGLTVEAVLANLDNFHDDDAQNVKDAFYSSGYDLEDNTSHRVG